MNQEFRFRGEEPTRVETLSDAGFALAIGLLLISTSPPDNFGQLREFTRDLLPFGICISLISMVWYQHFIFFIRYGFRNSRIVVLNTFLLFIILFYVYPLKFLAKFLVTLYSALFGIGSSADDLVKMIAWDDIPTLMIIYGLGASSIFLVLMLMYRYAYKKRDELQLNEIETFDTKASIYANLILGGIPMLSVLAAWLLPGPTLSSNLSGFIYFLYFPVMLTYGRLTRRRRKALLGKEATL